MQNKGVIITLIVLFSIIALSLLAFMIVLLQGNIKSPKFFRITKVSTTKIYDQTYEENFKNIEIDADVSDIYIKKSLDNKVRVIVYGEKKELKVQNTKEELKVRFQEKKCIGICLNMKKSKVEVYIPESYQEKLTIKNNYGDIKIDHFSEASIEVEEDCGDVSIIAGKKIIVNNNYGDIKVGEAKFAKLKESCGDITVRKVEDIIVENNYGDIEIKTVLNSVHAKEDCGDIEINTLSIKKDSSIKNSFGNIEIGRTNEIYIDAQTDLGEVEIERNSRSAKNTLTIKNNCGDITVENN